MAASRAAEAAASGPTRQGDVGRDGGSRGEERRVPRPVDGDVALVLHAHLPWVRHPEHERSLEERWLHEALWECYLPLLGALDRLADEGIAAPLTISVSPPLAAMLRDELLGRRFLAHLGRLDALCARERERLGADHELAEVAAFYEARLRDVRAVFARAGGDVLGALVGHARAGRIELMTTAATHAYLPGLRATPGSVRAQLRLGRRGFEALAGVRPLGLWLPECAYDARVGEHLAHAGVRYAVLDAHGLELARPRPPFGVHAPVLAPNGVAYFARDPDASHEVWSREVGYPGHPDYREFYRDVGFDLPESALGDELGPAGTRLMTGLKYHRITGRGLGGEDVYRPAVAAARAREHAARFVARREEALARARASGNPAPICIAPYDAELFGHWWFEGPLFLEEVLRRLDASARAGGARATTLRAHLERSPELAIVDPGASSWGEGGFGDVWTGPETAHLWRHVHHADRAVGDALRRAREASGAAGRALEQAIRELVLLEASDWAFMLRRGEMAPYAEARVRTHHARAMRLATLAAQPSIGPEDEAWIEGVRDEDRFLSALEGERIRDALDPW
jgi:1,4-alpha-glucan branching enzyme